jgi:transcription initiation factor TFIIIB Brf1 subunit/transcription initiation factor TFIIB
MRVLLCPICNSTEIELDAGGYTGKYYCKKCGYVGSLILEVDREELNEFMRAKQRERDL